jgi:hypothetical protein
MLEVPHDAEAGQPKTANIQEVTGNLIRDCDCAATEAARQRDNAPANSTDVSG